MNAIRHVIETLRENRVEALQTLVVCFVTGSVMVLLLKIGS